MSTSLTTQMNALTTIGISENEFVYVLDIPEKVIDLMMVMKAIIERDGFAKATETFLSCHWLRLDPSTKAGDDRYAIAGYGIALPKNGVALRRAKTLRPLGRFIEMTKNYLTRFTLRTTDNHGCPCVPYWSKAGANATVALNYGKPSRTKKTARAMGSKTAQKTASKPCAKQNATTRTKKVNGKFSVVMDVPQVIDFAGEIAKSNPEKAVAFLRQSLPKAS